MHSVPSNIQPAMPSSLAPQQTGNRQLYFSLLDERGGQINETARSASQSVAVSAFTSWGGMHREPEERKAIGES